MTNAIETLKLLGRLAELAEVWQDTEFNSVCITCHYIGQHRIISASRNESGPTECNSAECPRCGSGDIYGVKEDPEVEDIFKAEVRNVCLGLVKAVDMTSDSAINQTVIIEVYKNKSIIEILGVLAEHCLRALFSDRAYAYTLCEILCNKLGTSLIEGENL